MMTRRADSFGRLVPVETRHLAIHQHEIDGRGVDCVAALVQGYGLGEFREFEARDLDESPPEWSEVGIGVEIHGEVLEFFPDERGRRQVGVEVEHVAREQETPLAAFGLVEVLLENLDPLERVSWPAAGDAGITQGVETLERE